MGRKRKLGDVYAFILPNGQYAFAHVLQEAAIGVYKHLGTSLNDLPTDNNEYMFIISVYRSVFSKWIFIANRPFETEDDAWAPPRCMYDRIGQSFHQYYRGKIIPSTKEECVGLEPMAVWNECHLICRMMEGDKWKQWFPNYSGLIDNLS